MTVYLIITYLNSLNTIRKTVKLPEFTTTLPRKRSMRFSVRNEISATIHLRNWGITCSNPKGLPPNTTLYIENFKRIFFLKEVEERPLNIEWTSYFHVRVFLNNGILGYETLSNRAQELIHWYSNVTVLFLKIILYQRSLKFYFSGTTRKVVA